MGAGGKFAGGKGEGYVCRSHVRGIPGLLSSVCGAHGALWEGCLSFLYICSDLWCLKEFEEGR